MFRKAFKVGKATCLSCRFTCSTRHVRMPFQLNGIRFGKGIHAVRASGRESRATARIAPVRIGSRGFVGANALICKGVTIGDEAVVAAGSVLVFDVPAAETWGAIPHGGSRSHGT